jgi:hypothetical protein
MSQAISASRLTALLYELDLIQQVTQQLTDLDLEKRYGNTISQQW